MLGWSCTVVSLTTFLSLAQSTAALRPDALHSKLAVYKRAGEAYRVRDLNKQFSRGDGLKPYVRFELADTSTKDKPLVFDISDCGEVDMRNNTLRVHPTVFGIDGSNNAVRKCQSMLLEPLIHLAGGQNVYGIHVTDVKSGWGFQSADSRPVRISQIDPLWQLDQQYVIECYELPDPNAKDATCKNKKYFGKKCRVKIFKSNKCLAAEGYSAVDKSWYDLKTAACDEQYRDKSQTFNLVNVNAEFTQDNHIVVGKPSDPKNPPAPSAN